MTEDTKKEQGAEDELPQPILAERIIWPVQITALCPNCSKTLDCKPVPRPQIVDPNAPPPAPAFMLKCPNEGCGYMYVVNRQFPIVDFRTEQPACWQVLFDPEGVVRCESCVKVLEEDEPRHLWMDNIVTCVGCGGPEGTLYDPKEV